MKIIVFAGGGGKRFWPLSREKLPKQFVPVWEGKSTLQLTVEAIQPVYGWNSLFVATAEKYVPLVQTQIPEVPYAHIFTEPARRDAAAAVGLNLIRLRKLGIKEPVAILWGDCIVRDTKNLQEKLQIAENVILKSEAKIVFIGETPLFANEQIGWINVDGVTKSKDKHLFKEFIYRPNKEECEKNYKTGKWLWNTGYFISTVEYLLSIYEKKCPEIYQKLAKIEAALDTDKEASVIASVYPTIPEMHFDHAVPYNVSSKDALVIKTDMGWCDPGTLYALKQLHAPNDKNYKTGEVIDFNCVDSMLINHDKHKLVVGIGLNGTVVVNTKDVLLAINKDHIGDIKEVLEKIPTKFK
ncbi:hypothetical protein JW962_03350 [Candidatus Dojkabacteria bacterium]|nr:hypothetical protein [Candidatus Dojkabacteria bacterium]